MCFPETKNLFIVLLFTQMSIRGIERMLKIFGRENKWENVCEKLKFVRMCVCVCVCLSVCLSVCFLYASV